MKERKISTEMLNAFLQGELHPLLEAVHKDDTLDLELRGTSVNIYYRGGSLFKITEKKGQYTIFFNKKYCTPGNSALEEHPDVKTAVNNIPFYKQAMDWWFHKHPKYEREFQQVIARENNNLGNISRGTDYYIVDIEYANKIAGADKAARFDMVALKWLSNGAARKDSKKVSLALIEVKFGNGALQGKAGVSDHLKDLQHFLSDQKNLQAFCEDMSEVFAQKCELGLVDGLQEKQFRKNKITISNQNPEVIFIFANHDPDSKILDNLKISGLENCSFPVLVANASSMGYALYADQMTKLSCDVPTGDGEQK